MEFLFVFHFLAAYYK